MPLGGNTVFFRRDLLERAGGWDDNCLAEDCEIGIRLGAAGARTAVAYAPALATREETPVSVRSLVRQRTRWNQGYLQVLGKGEWRRLPTRRQRLSARYLLTMPLLQAFAGVMVPASFATILVLKAPVLVVLLTFTPLVPSLVTIGVELAGLHEFGRAFALRVRVRDYVKLVLGAFPYQALLAIAAVRAALRASRRVGDWEKTAHVGAHRPIDLTDELLA